jgi:polyhydroxyalkanoate synthase
MESRTSPVDAALYAMYRAQFGMLDIARRTQGHALGALGLNPTECPYDVTASGPYWRLRDYGRGATAQLLIVAAPIKRPYIWDLTPSVSAISYCLQAGHRVCLIEWLPASDRNGSNGLDEYADAISRCVARISEEAGGAKPLLIGHSLGGTLAAIYSALAPGSVGALALLGAPLCFDSNAGRFRDALVSLVPPTLSEANLFPGSLLSQASALASPDTFIWSRFVDAVCSLNDRQALDIHARIERWALDEVPLPGRLVHEIIEWLYRENRFCKGALTIKGTLVGPSTLTVPTLAVVNAADEMAPVPSVAPFADAMSDRHLQIIEYPGEVGVCLQHLGILVGRDARIRIWPRIVAWFNECSSTGTFPRSG